VERSYTDLDPEGYRAVAQQVVRQYPNVRQWDHIETCKDSSSERLADCDALQRQIYASRKYEDLEILEEPVAVTVLLLP